MQHGDFVDEYDAKMVQLMREHGWALQGVFPRADHPDDGPAFTYTVGAALYKLVGADEQDPELIVVGLPYDIAGPMLNDLVAQHRAGTRRIVVGQRYNDVVVGLPVTFVPVSDEECANHLTMANRLVAPALEVERIRALQLVWPDEGGRFPWQPGFDEKFREHQPILGTPPTD